MNNTVNALRPIVGIENRTAQEVFDIMSDRVRTLLAAAPKADHIPDVSKMVEAPKVEQEPCYECGSSTFVSTDGIDRACAPCNPDLLPAPASDELLEALKPFARYYDLNDCHERRPDDALEVPIYDLARAAELIAKHKGPQS